ncbi:pumilio homolog 23-like isoform X3 [Durio zibethinus]|uniref:Pumilio homolog 23-like isoform X3 n=1 Tax=Durio zibethinus TaxID=66656 RepID=A0A6P5X8U8_DURZI|nr:pumilio homolog 23-like isoform X3 [Durio zibethinus]
MGKKARKGNGGVDGDGYNKNVLRQASDGIGKFKKSYKHRKNSDSQTPVIRKQVEPETAKYFSEIASLFESQGVDVEERAVICGNALEEARGKEFELATDYIISHTLQTLLDGCDVDNLCSFLRGCSNVFPAISMDRSGSHVAETALKSLARHVQDTEAYNVIEETLRMMCEMIVVNPDDLMCNCYGSHVLRSLLCLCKGVPLDSSEFHGAKASKTLAKRLNFKVSPLDGNDSQHLQQGFPNLLKFLVSGMINSTRADIKTLQVDQYSSLVLQTALKLLAGDDQELLQIIPVLLGCNKQNLVEGEFIDMTIAGEALESMKETAFSHLMEVILEVAPESLYNEMFTKLFKNSLFKLSSHYCGNFVIQALISHARTKDQMELIWEELGLNFGDLLGMGRSGVIASLIAACQRLQTHEYKCCQALAAAFGSKNETSKFIVPRILFLDSYFSCEDKSSWSWAGGVKMQVMGSLILQAIFKFRSEWIQPYLLSIASMAAEHVLETAKDAGGACVIDAFLASDASAKQKRRLVVKYATKPDQWRSKQASKQSAYNEFYVAFGTSESPTKNKFLCDASMDISEPKELNTRKEIDSSLNSISMVDDTLAEKKKKRKKRKRDVGSEDGLGSKKVMENAVKNFLSSGSIDKKRRGASKHKLKF